MGFGVFVILKPADFSFAENVSCRLFSGQFIQVCLWQTCSEQKTGLNVQNQVLLFAADRDKVMSVRPNSSCPPRPTELGVGSVKSKIGIDESQSQDIHTGRALGTKGVQGDTALLCAVKPLKRNYTVLSYRTGGSVLAVGGFIRGNVIPLQKLMEYNSVRLPPFL